MGMYRGVWECIGVYGDVEEYMVLYRGNIMMYKGVW